MTYHMVLNTTSVQMSHAHFYSLDDSQPCSRCEHYTGLDSSGSHAVCMRGPGIQIQTFPKFGCVFWVRAIGADAEDDVK